MYQNQYVCDFIGTVIVYVELFFFLRNGKTVCILV
jgi:hypothetical protein